MKKLLTSMGVGMACGAGLAAYLLTNQTTKKKADKLLNKAMDEASQMMNKMN